MRYVIGGIVVLLFLPIASYGVMIVVAVCACLSARLQAAPMKRGRLKQHPVSNADAPVLKPTRRAIPEEYRGFVEARKRGASAARRKLEQRRPSLGAGGMPSVNRPNTPIQRGAAS